MDGAVRPRVPPRPCGAGEAAIQVQGHQAVRCLCTKTPGSDPDLGLTSAGLHVTCPRKLLKCQHSPATARGLGIVKHHQPTEVTFRSGPPHPATTLGRGQLRTTWLRSGKSPLLHKGVAGCDAEAVGEDSQGGPTHSASARSHLQPRSPRGCSNDPWDRNKRSHIHVHGVTKEG